GELLRLAIESYDLRLVHVAEPQVAVAVGAQAEQPGREAVLHLRDGELAHRARFRIKPPEVLLAETRVPRDALCIDDHVVRLDGLARQVVFGIDDARRAPARPRKGLQL